MMGEYRDCQLVPRIKVELENGTTASLTLEDCSKVVNLLLHHKLMQFDVRLDESVMGQPIQHWDLLTVSGDGESCWSLDGEPLLVLTVDVNDGECVGGRPRAGEEENDYPNLPSASDN
jgi:hypothetical protein